MYYEDEELKRKIKCMLNKYKVKYRSLSISDDRVVIGIEGSKSEYPYIKRKASNLGLRLVTAVYGRWVFRRNY